MGTATQTPARTTARSGGRFDLRAYLAGGTATAALIAAALLVFGSLAAYVAFSGSPIGGDDEGAGQVVVDAGAPETAAAALGGAAGAVAATAAAPTAIAPAPGGAAGGAGGPTPGGGAPGAPPASEPAPASGPLGGAVEDVENATGPVVDLPLSDLTDDLTGPIDDAVGGALDGAGGALGSPSLGGGVEEAVSGATGSLRGPGGLTDRVLGAG